ncbi:uncharacterized protein BDV17DRAFT_296627 [Aspergillus undulatus]|uniref:uncharacterized protein n=1 Tax=Aspergillus undulatus TaxID=1810928 RepID=UPI003CCE43B3
MPTYKACDACRRVRCGCVTEPNQTSCNLCLKNNDARHYSEYSRRPRRLLPMDQETPSDSKSVAFVPENSPAGMPPGVVKNQYSFSVLAPATNVPPSSNSTQEQADFHRVVHDRDTSGFSVATNVWDPAMDPVLDTALEMRRSSVPTVSTQASKVPLQSDQLQGSFTTDAQGQLDAQQSRNIFDDLLDAEAEAAAAHESFLMSLSKGKNKLPLQRGKQQSATTHDNLGARDSSTKRTNIIDEALADRARNPAPYGLLSLFAHNTDTSAIPKEWHVIYTASYTTPPPEPADFSINIDQTLTFSEEVVDVARVPTELLGSRRLLEQTWAEFAPHEPVPASSEPQIELSSLHHLLSCLHRMIDIWEIVLLHVCHAIRRNHQKTTKHNGGLNIVRTHNPHAERFMLTTIDFRVQLGLIATYTAQLRDAVRSLTDEVSQPAMGLPLTGAIPAPVAFKCGAEGSCQGKITTEARSSVAIHTCHEPLNRAVAMVNQAEGLDRALEQAAERAKEVIAKPSAAEEWETEQMEGDYEVGMHGNAV